jgi:hypothetical protein
MMIAQYTQAALVAQNRRLAAPTSVAVRERVPGFGPDRDLAPELEAAAERGVRIPVGGGES